MNRDFYHQTVTTKQVEDYISQKSGIDFSKVFDQYLRTTKIPLMEIKASANGTSYRWSNVIEGFNMPVRLNDGTWLKPTEEWQTVNKDMNSVEVDKNFYVFTKKG